MNAAVNELSSKEKKPEFLISHLSTRSEISNTILNYTIRLKSTRMLILYMGYDRVDKPPERYTCQRRIYTKYTREVARSFASNHCRATSLEKNDVMVKHRTWLNLMGNRRIARNVGIKNCDACR